MEFNRIPDEQAFPPEEYRMPAEQSDSSVDEFTDHQKRDRSEPKKSGFFRHNMLKRMVLMPAAGVVATVSILCAAADFDPLGKDIFNDDAFHYQHGSKDEEITVPEADDGITTVYVHVTYVPSGENYTSGLTDDDALEDAKSWVEKVGGDPSTMKLVRSDLQYTGMKGSDDMLYVGDIDDFDNIYVLQGEFVKTYRRDDYYEAYAAEGSEEIESGENSEDFTDVFPDLPNKEPDFGGKYAWSGEGSEEYVRFTYPDDENYRYIVMGSVWEKYGNVDEDGNVVPNTVVEEQGISYDKSTNTLTLENFSAGVLDLNLMGNGFKIRLIGENRIGTIIAWGAMYGGSVTFTGDGSLTLNESGTYQFGICLKAEQSQSCLMIEDGVSLDIYGGTAAVMIIGTSDTKGIYYPESVSADGGVCATGDFALNDNGVYSSTEGAFTDCTLLDNDTNEKSLHVSFTPSN